MPRITTKSILLDLLSQSGVGFSFGDLVARTQRRRAGTHKSTVWRNLRELMSTGQVVASGQRAGVSVYSLPGSDAGHVHMTLCRSCPTLAPVRPDLLHKLEGVLGEIEGSLERGSFANVAHAVQFEGDCRACQHQSTRVSGS